MTDPKIVTAAVLVIGNEILSGRTKDLNLGYIASGLTAVGVRLVEGRFIPDVEATGMMTKGVITRGTVR